MVHAMRGVREQSPDQPAERWLVLLRGPAAIDGDSCGQWYEAAEYDETPPVVRLTESAVAAYVDRQNPESDADRIGRVASLSTAAGGLVIDLPRGGTAQPSVASIVEANRELRAAGALEPLPVPFDRDRF